MPLPQISGEFGLTRAPELKFTPQGVAVMKLSLASDDSKYDRQTQQRSEATKKIYAETTLWRDDAEALAEMNLQPGAKVMVGGPCHIRKFQKQDGTEGQVFEIEPYQFGVRPAAVAKALGLGGGNQQGGGAPQGNDPWGTPPGQQQQTVQNQQMQQQQMHPLYQQQPMQGQPMQGQQYPQQGQPMQNNGFAPQPGNDQPPF